MTILSTKSPAVVAVLSLAVLLGVASLPLGASEPPAKPDQSRGVLAWLDFDQLQGPLAPDRSGNQNHATITEGTLVKGVSGTGVALDGRITQITCANSERLNPDRAISLEAWIKPVGQPPSGLEAVIRKQGSYALRFSGGRLGLLLWIGGDPVCLAGSKTDWRPNQWYHLAGTYDGGRMRLFVDGVEDRASPKPQTGLIDGGPLDCGIGSQKSMYCFGGVIDEVRIMSRAATAEEIRASHERGRRALLAQKDVVFEPKKVGNQLARFKKPSREIGVVRDGFLWIDAEDFADYGGWSLDTQFTHLMGSAYLIAAGVGRPVDDATVELDIPRAGNYRLWVRSKNWLKDHSPGRFAVKLGDVTSKVVFGTAASEDWLWQPAGEFKLDKGKTTLALHDLTGYYGRCDALLLTTDLKYTPPAAVREIQLERARLTGLSLEPKRVGRFDVIVVGAGAAGSCAALASARLGADTALLQNRPVLGGNASIELGVPICGAGSAHRNARESGIIEEVGRIKARFGFPKMSEAFRIAAKDEKNLSIFLNRHVFGVEMQGDSRIRAVKALDTLSGAITTYEAKLFIDCTGDGWVGYFAGAKFRLGRESRDEYGESLAPEKADDITMSGCIMGRRALSYRAENMGKPVSYRPPPWAAKLPPAEEFGRDPRGFVGGQWWLEHRGTVDDLWNAERARDELIRITFGYWDYIKNAWPERRRAANYALAYVPITDAKRETRRLLGDHVLTQNDVLDAVVFPDRVSYGGWPLDVHHPEGIFSGKQGPFHYNNPAPIYTIPFRCLYSANIDNLLFAGRDVSVTHIALGSVRVQGTLSPLGQAVGTAAALCAARDISPRELGKKQITQLQQTLLKHDQYIPGIANRDPLDLARRATPSASSQAAYELFDRKRIRKDDDIHPLVTSRAVMFPRGKNRRLESIFLALASSAEEPVEVTLHLRGASASGDFSSKTDIATARAVVPAKKESWVEFTVEPHGRGAVRLGLVAADRINLLAADEHRSDRYVPGVRRRAQRRLAAGRGPAVRILCPTHACRTGRLPRGERHQRRIANRGQYAQYVGVRSDSADAPMGATGLARADHV